MEKLEKLIETYKKRIEECGAIMANPNSSRKSHMRAQSRQGVYIGVVDDLKQAADLMTCYNGWYRGQL